MPPTHRKVCEAIRELFLEGELAAGCYNGLHMLGYLDESGAPGKATNTNDFLAVSLVVFNEQSSAEKGREAIIRLRQRLKLRSDYEFHRSHNSHATQSEFIRLMRNIDFKFITIAIKKSGSRLHASYPRIVKLLVQEIATRFPEGRIEMDANPILCTALRHEARQAKLWGLKIKETKSHKNDLIQLADYTVSLSVAKVQNLNNSVERYRAIAKKQLLLAEIRA